MKVILVGAGAFGIKHLEAMSKIDGIEVLSLVSRDPVSTAEVAKKWKIPHCTTDLAQALAQPGVQAALLCSPTQLHAQQALQCLRAGKHVMIEIPIADSLAGAERVVKAQQETGLTVMGGHTRRFNPSHQWIHRRIQAGGLKVLQMDVQTYFFRRTNMNALGQPRSWTDNLLWHHAAHTVDLFAYQCGHDVVDAHVLAGPINRDLGVPMDMSIQLRTSAGQICTLSLSFNNEGPLGSFFRS